MRSSFLAVLLVLVSACWAVPQAPPSPVAQPEIPQIQLLLEPLNIETLVPDMVYRLHFSQGRESADDQYRRFIHEMADGREILSLSVVVGSKFGILTDPNGHSLRTPVIYEKYATATVRPWPK